MSLIDLIMNTIKRTCNELQQIESSTGKQITCIEVQHIESSSITLKYHTLPNTNPNQYNHFIAVWENDIYVPPLPSNKFIMEQPIISESIVGAITLNGLDTKNKPYVIGYCVGHEITNVCATVYVPMGEEDILKHESSEISLKIPADIPTDALAVNYSVPPGINPQEYKHWIGLWESDCIPYLFNPEPLRCHKIDSKHRESSINISGTAFLVDTNYTLAYFTGLNNVSIACVLHFKTGATEELKLKQLEVL